MPWSAQRRNFPARFPGPVLLALFVVCLGGWGGLQGCRKAQGPTPAAEFALPDLAGKTVHLADFRGKVVLVDFWATWCGPCQESIPYYEAIYQRHGAQGLVVLGVNEDSLVPAVATFVRKNQMTYPVLLDSDNKAYDSYDVDALPSSFLIDKDGKIQDAWVGFDEEIAKDEEKSVMALLNPSK